MLTPPPGRELVIAADAMVQGVHFLPDDPPDLVARKLLRTNLSDLAAMGAEPWGYLLTVAVPRATPNSGSRALRPAWRGTSRNFPWCCWAAIAPARPGRSACHSPF